MAADPLTHRPFLELSAQKLVKVPSKVTEIRPGVIVRRPLSSKAKAQSEPDRQYVDSSPELKPSSVQDKGPEPVVPKKKTRAKRSSPQQREIAVARVTALTKAGENRDKALEKVAKELGYASGSLNRWLVDSNKAAKKKRPHTRRATAAPVSQSRVQQPARVANGSPMNAIGEALTMVVREIVSAELKRLLAQGLG